MAPGVVETLAGVLESGGADLRAWGLAWARVAPSVLLIPAFGLRALPAPARIALGLSLAVGIAPALTPIAEQARPWLAAFVVELGRGLPVALTASIALWVANMAGGVVDDLRGAREPAAMPNLEAGSSPIGALLAMLVAIAFLESGGAARVASVLAEPELAFSDPLARAAANLAGGIELAVAVAAPVVAASIVFAVASSLIARAANPAYIEPLLAPLRSLALLAVTALVLDRMLELLVLSARVAPR